MRDPSAGKFVNVKNYYINYNLLLSFFQALEKALLLIGFALCGWAPVKAQDFERSKEATNFSWQDLVCADETSPDCYREIYCKIFFNSDTGRSGLFDNCESLIDSVDIYYTYVNGYTQYRLHEEKPTTVFVTIHGLWGNSSQFVQTLARYAYVHSDSPYNIIHLTLPGHLKIESNPEYLRAVEENPPFATYREWLEAVENALWIARQLGENTVVVGQSTGGLLAAAAAAYYPNLVDQVVLIEPAIQVQSLMKLGACVGGRYLPRSIVKGLGHIVGIEVPLGVSIEMGCEVKYLAQELFGRDEDYESFARSLQVPLLMFNNANDKIVSPEANRKFFDALVGEKEYFEVYEFAHGDVTLNSSEMLAERIFRFLHYHAPGLSAIYRGILLEKLALYTKSDCGYKADLTSCQKEQVRRVTLLPEMKEQVCKFVQDETKCRHLSETLDILVDHWAKNLQFVEQMGIKEYRKFRESLSLAGKDPAADYIEALMEL